MATERVRLRYAASAVATRDERKIGGRVVSAFARVSGVATKVCSKTTGCRVPGNC